MVDDSGQLLLILASGAPQTAMELATATGLSPAETVRRLHRLATQGFIITAGPAGMVAVYRLNPKDVRTDALDPRRRILLIDDDLAVADLLTMVLEDQGYTLVVSRTRAEAVALLGEVRFDLVITDGFSATGAGVVASAADVLDAAGVTPVALFTAHQVELDEAQAAGFRDLLAKPFDLAALEQQIGALLD